VLFRNPRPRTIRTAAVFAGGALGAVARYELNRAMPVTPGHWPWATFTANIAGAVLVGYLVTRLQERLAPSRGLRPFLVTGLCGGLTTFSTLQVEFVRLGHEGHPLLGLAYMCTSIACGAFAVACTTQLVRRAELSA
jgi:CrcB protein